MKKRNLKYFVIASSLLVAFVLWTMAVCRIDVQQIGPRGSAVGLATVNRFVHDLTGVHMWLYILTDWLGLVPVGFGLCFAALGLAQWIRRKSIRKVDRSLLALGGFYIAVMVAYVYFEMEVINFRPVLIEGVLEASYPSSTTLLAMCVMPTAIMQFRERIRSRMLRGAVSAVILLLIVFMVVGRLISGVHWFTDIVGGTLLSAGLVTMYHAVCAVR
jgi:undecaprenyl-diphosphatase